MILHLIILHLQVAEVVVIILTPDLMVVLVAAVLHIILDQARPVVQVTHQAQVQAKEITVVPEMLVFLRALIMQPVVAAVQVQQELLLLITPVPGAPAARVLHHLYQVLQLITLEAEVVVAMLLQAPAALVVVELEQLIQAPPQLPEPQILVEEGAAEMPAGQELLHMVQMAAPVW